MNILFITSTRIGDAVLSTGVLAHLIASYPNARITLACGPAAMPLFAAAPKVVKRIEMVKRKWGLHWFDLWRECVTERWGWDMVVDLRGSAIAWLLPTGTRHILQPAKFERHQVVQ